MGTTAYAYLFYGVLLEGAAELPWDTDEFEGELDSWLRERSAEDVGVFELVRGGHRTAPTDAIAIRTSMKKHYVGGASKSPLEIADLAVDARWADSLTKLCDAHGLTHSRPAWWLLAAAR